MPPDRTDRMEPMAPPAVRLGPLYLPSPVILAPMAGITDLPFRRLADAFGVGLTVSEMIMANALCHGGAKTRSIAARDPRRTGPQAVQIAGSEPVEMAEAARRVADLGADLIDINMGCPVPKIAKKGGGAALLRDPDHAERIVAAVVRATDRPVSIKLRLGWSADDGTADDIIRRAANAGAVCATIHGRTAIQGYSGRADWHAIARICAQSPIPVIGNGDLDDAEAAVRRMRDSGAAAVMIGRAACGRPWLMAEIGHRMGYPPHRDARRIPTRMDDIGKLVQEHGHMLAAHYGTSAGLHIARKHLAWYARGFPGASAFRDRINRLEDPNAVADAIAAFFRETGNHRMRPADNEDLSAA